MSLNTTVTAGFGITGGLVSDIANVITMGFLSPVGSSMGSVDAAIRINKAMSLYAGNNDNLLELVGAKNLIDDANYNAATVEMTITDSAGKPVIGSPVTLAYVPASSGNYRAVLDKAAGFIAGQTYTIKTVFVEASVDGEWEHDLVASKRTS